MYIFVIKLNYLTESLRIEKDDLAQIDFRFIDQILASLKDPRTRRYLEGMNKELST